MKAILMRCSIRLLTLPVFLFFSNLLHAQVNSVETIGLTVKDMDVSIHFYQQVLGFQKISDQEFTGADYESLENVFGLRMRVVRMQLGDETIELTDYLTSGGRPIPLDARANDLAFQHIAIVVSNMDLAYQQIRKYKAEFVSTGPQTLPKSIPPAYGVKAFYFHDPDNHNLELIYFPKGKGQPKWHKKTNRIFLGIDHTAIGIKNTEASLQFYSTILGFERKGESFNFGTEQEHLNNVEGASLHITGLRTAAGPGIEFLQYLKPGPGKDYPIDTRADDIWYWQTTLLTKDADALYQTLKSANYPFISRNLIFFKQGKNKSWKAFIVKDPDGHAMLIKQVGISE